MVARVVGPLLALIVVASGCQQGGTTAVQAGAATGAGGLTVAAPPTAHLTLDRGQVSLDPTTASPQVDGASAATQIATNPIVARFLAAGYHGVVQFGDYTDTTQGDAPAASNGHPAPGGPTSLTFDHKPMWTVLIQNISAADAAFMAFGPRGAQAPTGTENLFYGFSADGSQFLTGTIY